jgi:hypothetical protein
VNEEGLWPKHTAIRAPQSRFSQPAPEQHGKCRGHNQEIYPRVIEAEVHDGEKEQRKQWNSRYSGHRCYQLNSPAEA